MPHGESWFNLLPFYKHVESLAAFLSRPVNDEGQTWDLSNNDREALTAILEELKRLKSGNLTSVEFNELCHNVHEQGCPITREQHTVECDKFRNQLFVKQKT